ncbi:hypothetical protein OPT61_g9507 [Boeremia exigua]|uniref:Uncharacterized protein n=1 Tax=Boeremia exigua TaxID=749465 RepID=A0ACC2HTS5_9PLEO|nr:hypothetical protein OPT61_g9507 [Boeremia exigua]
MAIQENAVIYKIVRIPRASPNFADLVTKSRTFRLHALETDTTSFLSPYAVESALPLSVWHKRLSNPEVTTLVCVATTAPSDANDETLLIEGQWVGFAAVRGPMKYKDYYASPEMQLPIPENPHTEARWHVYDLYTSAAHRGRGLAARLGNACIALAVEHTRALTLPSPAHGVTLPSTQEPNAATSAELQHARIRLFMNPKYTWLVSGYESQGFRVAGRVSFEEGFRANAAEESIPEDTRHLSSEGATASEPAPSEQSPRIHEPLLRHLPPALLLQPILSAHADARPNQLFHNTATTFAPVVLLSCGPCLPVQRPPKKLPVIHESSRLDPSAGPRPSLGRAHTSPPPSRASTTSSSKSTLNRRSGTPRPRQPSRKPSLFEKIAYLEANPVDKGPWHPDSAYHDAEAQRRKELKRLCRQLDGSRSRSNSLTPSVSRLSLSRVNSARSFNSASQLAPISRISSLKHSETGSTVSSIPSSISGKSTRLHEVAVASQDDRVTPRPEAQEQQLREPGDGENCEQDSTPHGGPANARAIYGPNRCLDVISFAPTSARKIGAAIVEHNPTSRSYVHCTSAKENSRLAAYEHLLVITEDLLQRLMDTEGIGSSGWLPATPQSQHAATYTAASVSGSVAGSMPASRRSSVTPQEFIMPPPERFVNDFHSPHSSHHIQRPPMGANAISLVRGNSDTAFGCTTPQPPIQIIPRTNSDVVIQEPRPVPAGQYAGNHSRVQWKLGSEG